MNSTGSSAPTNDHGDTGGAASTTSTGPGWPCASTSPATTSKAIAASFSTVNTFCIHAPARMPNRFTPTMNTIAPTATGFTYSSGGSPIAAHRYSANIVATAATLPG